MKYLRYKVGLLMLLTSSGTILSQTSLETKDQIVKHFKEFEGTVTSQSLNSLLTNLSDLSIDTEEMCFNSLGVYNNCSEDSDKVFATVLTYLDNLIGKEVTVKLTKWNKPWEDEDFHTLRFEIYYKNTNPDYPVEMNFDTFILDIDKGKTRNVILAREWVDLVDYGN